MKKALLVCVGLSLVFASYSAADDALKEAGAQEPKEAESVTYRAASSAVEIKSPSCEGGPREIITDMGNGVWVRHVADRDGCQCSGSTDSWDEPVER